MKIVIALDSFKGSLSSVESGTAVAEGIRSIFPSAQIVIKSLADGGEGTVDAFEQGAGAKKVPVTVTGPLGTPVSCSYAVLEADGTAIIEVAAAAGLTLVPPEARNPLHTTSYGVGEIICDAIQKGYRKFVVGIGGSATNDCGLGMLEALGFVFLDRSGNPVGCRGRDVASVQTILTDSVLPELRECTFTVACDVTNPLCGKNGASAVFGPQKGAAEEIVAVLDQSLAHFAEVTRETLHKDTAELPGAGAAGGLGYAFTTYLNGELKEGVKVVLETVHLEEELADADFVITGEGKLDVQTSLGKAPVGVARLGKKYGCSVIAFAGAVSQEAENCHDAGIDAFFPIVRGPISLADAMDKDTAYENLKASVTQVFRLIKAIV